MKIMMSGGGTLGPVTPLIALIEYWRQRDNSVEFIWVGTEAGPEREFLKTYKVPFFSISSAKLRRYFALENFLIPFELLTGLVQSYLLLRKQRPNLVVSAGGYVSVPLVWAAWLMGIPSWTHQQDCQPLLANKLMIPFVNRVSIVFEESACEFPKKKVVYTGNPVRPDMLNGSKQEAQKVFGLEQDVPTILVLGGGTGATWINDTMIKIGSELTKKAQVIHSTGKGKLNSALKNLGPRYHVFEFIGPELSHAFAAADIVISRGGMGQISELATLGKPAIFIPISNVFQKKNTSYLLENNAAIVLDQDIVTSSKLKEDILNLLDDKEKQKDLSEKIRMVFPAKPEEKMIESMIRLLGN